MQAWPWNVARSIMNLVIFDIDGTLTQTDFVDEECFVKAFHDEFGITGINTNWVAYPHCTDSGIALAIFEKQMRRAPKNEEIGRLKDRILDLLRSPKDRVPGM